MPDQCRGRQGGGATVGQPTVQAQHCQTQWHSVFFFFFSDSCHGGQEIQPLQPLLVSIFFFSYDNNRSQRETVCWESSPPPRHVAENIGHRQVLPIKVHSALNGAQKGAETQYECQARRGRGRYPQLPQKNTMNGTHNQMIVFAFRVKLRCVYLQQESHLQ